MPKDSEPAPTNKAPPSKKSTAKIPLATRAIRGLFSTGGASLFQVFIVVALYKYLPLDEMGLFEAALIPVLLFAQLGNFGLSWSIIQYKEATDLHFSSAFWANLLLGLVLTASLWAAAPLIGRIYTPESADSFPQIFRPLILLIPFASVSHLFRARLTRDLDFHPTARAEIVSVLCNAIVVITCMSLSYGILSPVYGAIAREIALATALAYYARWRPQFSLSPTALRQILPFALNFTGSRSLTFLNVNIARLLIPPLLGDTAMGYYSFAHRLTLQVLTRLSTVITQVVFPTFSSIQQDDNRLRQGYLHAVGALALLFGPALAGLAVFAPEILYLAEQEPALTVLRLLALTVLFKGISVMTGSVYLAKGKSNYTLYWSVFNLAVSTPIMYWAASTASINGLAAAVAATTLVMLFLSQHLANRLIGLSFAAFFTTLARPAAVAAVVLATLWLLRPLLPGPPLAVLAAGFVLGLLALALALRFLAWELCLEYWRQIRGKGSTT
jgi:O-antigen/teichoic acid export membrane protein